MQLFAFGSNGSGQLGLGHTDDVSTPTACLFSSSCISQEDTKTNIDNEDDDDDCITHIAAGGNHTLLLTKLGAVYAAGCNEDGRCGLDLTAETSFSSSAGKKEDDEYGKVKGKEENLEETERGKREEEERKNLLHFKRILLPHPYPSSSNSNPDSKSLVRRFKFIAATWEGSILVASVRKATGASCTEQDACPQNKAQANTSATHQSEPELFEDVVFVLGTGSKGELGLGPNNNNNNKNGLLRPPSPLPLPRGSMLSSASVIPDFPPSGTEIIALDSGMSHSVAVLANGEVYGWGAARKGQLGEARREDKIVWAPVKVSGIPFAATGAACGREFTVVMGDRESGQFVVLGDPRNKWGVLSDAPSSALLGDDDAFPRGSAYTNIVASWNGVYVHAAPSSPSTSVTSSEAGAGSLIAWGRNDRGQLPPPNLPTPVQLAVGSEHALALLGDGTVAAFGWGEHGNCGPDTDSRGNVAGTYNVISPPDAVPSGSARVIGVGAGCATSWIIVA